MRTLLPGIRLGLKTKFVLMISLLILITSFLLCGFLIRRQSLLIERELGKRAESLVRNLAFNSEYGVLVENRTLLLNLMKGLSQEEDVEYVVVQDRIGNVLAEWDRTAKDYVFCTGRLSVMQQTFGEGKPCERHFAVKGEEFCDFSYPIKTTRVERSKEELGLILEDKKDLVTREERIGVAHIGLFLQHMRKEIADMKRIVILLTTLVVAVGVLLTIFLVNIFVRPVRKLVQATERVASGDLSQMVRVAAKDEIGKLADSFNRMITSLKESREEIERYNRTLENKVKERTAELEKSNRELEKAMKILKQTQSQLIQVEKMAAVGQLAAGVAHELNNPLGGILGYSQFALEKINQKPISQFSQEDHTSFLQFLTDIEEQTKRCRSIIQSLLKFSRASRKEESEPTDLSSVIKETLVFTKHQIEKGNVTLVQSLADSLPLINGHPSELQQIFTNLILNALQAMPGGGTLTITSRVREDRRAVEVSFADTGVGIPEENVGKIFEPFFTTKRVGEGTGLGLSVSYGLVKNHGGEIEVESKRNQGSVFTVILPVSAEEVVCKIKDEKELAVSQ
ncbi:MAG: ATP-binding protein [Candidatus Zixiibacteriota bacterium]